MAFLYASIVLANVSPFRLAMWVQEEVLGETLGRLEVERLLRTSYDPFARQTAPALGPVRLRPRGPIHTM